MRATRRKFTHILAMALGAAALAWSAGASFAQPPVMAMQEQGGIRHACGGVGDEEREALLALRPQANMELLLVSEKRGSYLAGVTLRLARAGSGAPGVQIEAEGPICLIQVPPGTYRVEAVYEGVTRTRNVAASAARPKPAVFAFPDASDAQSQPRDARASG
ncbi:MAG: hypothetical protein ACT4P4_06505 [Betaproteobacteria bacterium]